MTLFDSLFRMPSVRDRHNNAPFRRKRARFLAFLRRQGCKETTIRQFASHLLQVNRALGFKTTMRVVTAEELKEAGRAWSAYVGPLRRRLPGKCTYELFMRIARGWLRYNRCLGVPTRTRLAEERLKNFEARLKNELGLATTTIETRARHASFFLLWLAQNQIKLPHVTIGDVERYLDEKERAGWALTTRVTAAHALGVFLRHGEHRKWVRPGLYNAMPIFHVPQHLSLRQVPSWRDVRRLISSLKDRTPLEIRQRAMILLMSVYGLRFGEIRDLRVNDVDFKNRVLTVLRGKTRTAQRFPLTRELFLAIKKYVFRGRPQSDCPNLFITHGVPYRPIAHGTVYLYTSKLFEKSAIATSNKGPHAFRHSCARRLLESGVSAPDVAAFLGHRDMRSVRDYARYDIKGLRQVAKLPLAGLL